MGSFEISRAGICPKHPEETVLFPVYTTRQRNFALYVTGVIFTSKYFKVGLNTTGLSQSHFRNLSACSIIVEMSLSRLVQFHSNPAILSICLNLNSDYLHRPTVRLYETLSRFRKRLQVISKSWLFMINHCVLLYKPKYEICHERNVEMC